MNTSLQTLRLRVDGCVRTFPSHIRNDALVYFSTARRTRSNPSVVRERNPDLAYWLLLPLWLNPLLPGTIQTRQHIVDEILWGQYCLYLTFRIEDDLRDGDASSKSLRAAAKLFRKESRNVLSTFFPSNSPFWKFYEDAIISSGQAISRVERAQQANVRIMYPAQYYAQVASVLRIGTNAVCRLSRRMDLVRPLSRFADELAMAGQILDDIRDMREDAERGRFNYAARACLNATGRIPLADPMIRIAWGYLTTDVSVRLLDEVVAHIACARRAVTPVHLPGSDRFLGSYVTAIRSAERLVERERRKWHRRGTPGGSILFLCCAARPAV